MTNIAATLEAQLDAISLRQLRGIAAVADIHDAHAYLVGGAVRDALLGMRVSDIDIAVIGMPPSFPQGIARALNGRVIGHSQFNTFSVSASGRHIDLAMARRETYTHAGALPTVLPGTMEQDLARRDFSINAMAVSLNAGSFGELVDPFESQSDLKRGLVRALHDDSFRDDATRILRAARYAVRLGFTMEAHTEHLLRRDASYIDTISPARLRDEFVRVLNEGRSVQTLELLYRLGALQATHPALMLDDVALAALRRAAEYESIDKPALFLSILTYGMTAADRVAFSDRLRLPSRLARVAHDTGLAKSRARDDLSIETFSRSEIYMRLRALDEAAILGCALSEEDNLASQRLMLFLDELSHVRPLLKGRDLLALGVPQGPKVGELLFDLLEARLDQKIETRQDEIAFIESCLSCPSMLD